MPTTFEKWSANAVEKAEVKGKAESVLVALRAKFKKIPPEIEEAVLARTDLVALASLVEHAIDCESLDDFATML